MLSRPEVDDGLTYNGIGVGNINQVVLRRAQLVPGWMTVSGSTPGA